ncbi:hypothetical protein ANN_20838 [Periplaneta americana]|uniref:DDE-1 domain-containing protein n=1 Tax=Periplaneta americana TaxID=6978 RepID=A0ABQ8SDQ6_PERAM|nr:hypothetical protein ANN_20838 [Periplaneta americana]
MDLREVGYDDRDWINVAQDRDRWRTYVGTAVNLCNSRIRCREEKLSLNLCQSKICWDDEDTKWTNGKNESVLMVGNDSTGLNSWPLDINPVDGPQLLETNLNQLRMRLTFRMLAARLFRIVESRDWNACLPAPASRSGPTRSSRLPKVTRYHLEHEPHRYDILSEGQAPRVERSGSKPKTARQIAGMEEVNREYHEKTSSTSALSTTNSITTSALVPSTDGYNVAARIRGAVLVIDQCHNCMLELFHNCARRKGIQTPSEARNGTSKGIFSLVCEENNARACMQARGLPPHSTHVLQPLDRTLFKSLKTKYHKNAIEWIHPNENLSKTFEMGWASSTLVNPEMDIKVKARPEGKKTFGETETWMGG